MSGWKAKKCEEGKGKAGREKVKKIMFRRRRANLLISSWRGVFFASNGVFFAAQANYFLKTTYPDGQNKKRLKTAYFRFSLNPFRLA